MKEEKSPTTEEKVKPKPKRRPKKVKNPNRLTKAQKAVMDVLDAGGYAGFRKTMNDTVRYQTSDANGSSLEYVPAKTIISLTKRQKIYKANDGKFYSIKYHEGNESKPIPVTGDGIVQTKFGLKFPKARGNHNIGRPDSSGDTSKI
jgi:hypothetical protein